MSIEVKLPELGEGIETGDVVSLLVSVGDKVAENQGILELETDKATVEVPSPQAGVVEKIHVSAGDQIPVGATLLTLTAEAARPSKPSRKKPPQPAAVPAAPKPPEPKSKTPKPQPTEPAPTPQAAPGATATGIPAGPAVRRFAREVGVDLARVPGSGEGGRITRDDVLRVVRQASQSMKTDDATGQDAWGPIRAEPLSRIRKTIAEKMHESWATVPRVTNFDDADVTELEQIRQQSKADYADKGIKLTQMAFVIKAVAMSLDAHPHVNASLDLDNGQVIYKQYVNIGIAVDTERGLVVPALRGANKLSILDIARKLGELAEAVRTNDFTPDDLRGGTFTISNLGAVGGSYSTPIVNIPEVAILLVGRSRETPTAVNGQIKLRLMMPLSLSYDHRLVDGATAARFLNQVMGYLEAPTRLLLAP